MRECFTDLIKGLSSGSFQIKLRVCCFDELKVKLIEFLNVKMNLQCKDDRSEHLACKNYKCITKV